MFDFPQNEQKILKFWKEKDIFKKVKERNKGKKPWSFFDGPITANNPMGVHHAWGRTYKDLFQRFKSMEGFDLRFQNGFDCQGLWVEVEVEKELGFKTKKDIEKYGVAEFVQKCKDRVYKYSEVQKNQSVRLGQFMDWDNSYFTMSDENNYMIWHFLKECDKKGFLYKGRDVVPWCIRCGTAISQHEILTEDYKDIVHRSVFIKLEVLGRKNTFFLAWTTTPWTLPANVSLAVNPKLTYVEVKDSKGDIFIILKSKANVIPNGKIIKEYLGKNLEGLKYKGMFDELPAVESVLANKEHVVILWKDISEEEGTGVVHIAPGCGQEDFKLSKEYELPVVNPTDDESRYDEKQDFGFLNGKLVNEVNDLIFANLKGKGFVYRIEDYKHKYPICWRCKNELIFRLVDEWYISMKKLRKDLIAVAKKMNWIPSFGLDRELDWLKNMQDWLISKKRYWGLALPIFECKKCGNFEVIGSKEELKKRAVSGWDKFEGHSPHKPYIDEVKIKCKCGDEVSRILDVGNPWLDAGIIPFSTLKDPKTGKLSYLSDKKYFKKWFPADLICESFPGQFKNWFYALIVMSTVLKGINPTKTVFGYASVKDEKGEEMHKSKGNAIWFDDAVEKIGADVMRFMYARQDPANNLKFGFNSAEEIKRKLLTLYNVYTFFFTYVKKEEFPQNTDLLSKNILDIWIISKFNNLMDNFKKNLDKLNPDSAVLAFEKFFIDDLSLWYVRRGRKRFHEGSAERNSAIETLYYILLNLTKTISPIMPFFAEEMYLRLKENSMEESVHLNSFPVVSKKKINPEIEEMMDEVRNIVTLALAERAEAGIKVRQPLSLLTIKNEKSKLRKEKELLNLIKEEVNVKEILFDKDIDKEVKLDTTLSNELKEEGLVREVIRHIQEMRKKTGCRPEDKISIRFKGESRLNQILSRNTEFVLRETKAKSFTEGDREKQVFDAELQTKLEGENLWLSVKKE